jgi:hypothetical protein
MVVHFCCCFSISLIYRIYPELAIVLSLCNRRKDCGSFFGAQSVVVSGCAESHQIVSAEATPHNLGRLRVFSRGLYCHNRQNTGVSTSKRACAARLARIVHPPLVGEIGVVGTGRDNPKLIVELGI